MEHRCWRSSRRAHDSLGITILLVEQNANLAQEVSHYGYVLETRWTILHDHSNRLRANEELIALIYTAPELQLLSRNPCEGPVELKPRMASVHLRSVSLLASSINSRFAISVSDAESSIARKISRSSQLNLFRSSFLNGRFWHCEMISAKGPPFAAPHKSRSRWNLE